jgi:hypothetical protein
MCNISTGIICDPSKREIRVELITPFIKRLAIDARARDSILAFFFLYYRLYTNITGMQKQKK